MYLQLLLACPITISLLPYMKKQNHALDLLSETEQCVTVKLILFECKEAQT